MPKQNDFLFKDRCSVLDFVSRIDPHNVLSECNCTAFNRKNPENMRDRIDELAVNIFEKLEWPKSKPIEVVDTMAGQLLQTVTTVLSLVNAGYQVNICVIDHSYIGDMTKDARIQKFLEIIAHVNEMTQNYQSIQLKGVFSRVESYLATVQGSRPIQNERVSQEELRRRVAQGESRRYLKMDLRTETEKIKGIEALQANELDENRRFQQEFLIHSSCKDALPNLVLSIDDMIEILPCNIQDVHRHALHAANHSDQNHFMYRNEMYNPIRTLNPEALFISTKKSDVSPQKIFIWNNKEYIDYTDDNSLNAILPLKARPNLLEKNHESCQPDDQDSLVSGLALDGRQFDTKENLEKLSGLIGNFLNYCEQLPNSAPNKRELLSHARVALGYIDISNECYQPTQLQNTLKEAQKLIKHRNCLFVRCMAAIANVLIFMTIIGAVASMYRTGSLGFFGVFKTHRDGLLDNTLNGITHQK